MQLRNKISPKHAIFGDGFRMLDDDEVVREGDQTGTLGTLLSITVHVGWSVVDCNCVGKTVQWLCDESGDIDGEERVFRRRT